jgi:two-component system chemotaxis response regulator CheB
MPATFTGSLARRLDKLCALPVSEVVGPTPLLPGHVYIARGDADIILSARGTGTIALSAPSSPEYRWHPSVDRLVESAMAHREAARIVGILMTGMGNDGARSMTRLRAAGGRTLAEAEETAIVWGMPGELVKAGGAEIVAPLDRIAHRLMDMVPSR